MNRGQRYEPVPQRYEEPIILDQLSQHSYNYNSGIPNSTSSAASIRTENILAPSLPNSPPPSFHTHSSPGTPRPTPSTTSTATPSYAELWGVAPSTLGAETETLASGLTGRDGVGRHPAAEVASLKQRVEWLEESIGKLLLEKDVQAEGHHQRDNCCVTFTDASPDLERALTVGKGSNCCVSYSGGHADAKRKKHARILMFAALFVVCVMFTIVATAGVKKSSGNWSQGVVDEVGKS